MATKDDGGSAFPMLGSVAFKSDWQIDTGMSLRDWFAGQALASIASQHSSLDAAIAAAKAYNFADAMIAASRAIS